MSRVLVVGGTGLAGRAITAEAIRRGHEVVVAARRVPDDDAPASVPGAVYVTTDIVTGEGIEEAVEGADVVVDASNGGRKQSAHVFTAGAQNLLHTAARYGVHHAVLLSIVNVDRSSFGYYRAKAAQERIYLESPLEARIVRATQFHDLVTSIFEGGRRLGVLLVPSRSRFQPIAVTDVAHALVDAAEGAGEGNAVRTVGGPRVETARALAEQWRAATGTRRPLLPIRLPGALGAAWRTGENLAPEQAVDGQTYAEWASEKVRARS